MAKAAINRESDTKLHVGSYEPFIKYMGSKAKLLDYVIGGLNKLYTGGPISDLFAGSACLAGALRDQAPFISNDIQSYSGVLSAAYTSSWNSNDAPKRAAVPW